MSGFVCLHREAFDHPLLQDGEHFRAWFWLVSRACWKPTKFDVGGRVITLERGQLSCTVREIAQALGWSKSTVDRFIQRLVNEEMVICTRAKTGTNSGTSRSIITICNYEKYQDTESQGGTDRGTKVGQSWDIKEQVNQLPLAKAKGPDDDRKAFWDSAKGYLGKSKSGMIGKWISQYGREETARAITAAQIAEAVDPVPYIAAALRKRATNDDEVRFTGFA